MDNSCLALRKKSEKKVAEMIKGYVATRNYRLHLSEELKKRAKIALDSNVPENIVWRAVKVNSRERKKICDYPHTAEEKIKDHDQLTKDMYAMRQDYERYKIIEEEKRKELIKESLNLKALSGDLKKISTENGLTYSALERLLSRNRNKITGKDRRTLIQERNILIHELSMRGIKNSKLAECAKIDVSSVSRILIASRKNTHINDSTGTIDTAMDKLRQLSKLIQN